MSALIERLEATAAQLGARSVELMYARNIFWEERYGERGRKHSAQDARHHITYLVEALRVGPEVFVGYARWLQSVLTHRGMCTRHLIDHFAVLRELLGDDEDAAPAIDVLRAGEAALLAVGGDAQVLLEARPRVIPRAMERLYREHPEWLERFGEKGRARCRDDFDYHLFYLADALMNDRPELFRDYREFLVALLGRRGIDFAHVDQALAALADALSDVPDPARSRAIALLRAP